MKLNTFRIIQVLEFVAAMIAVLPFRHLPCRMALRLGEFIGDLLYRLLPRRRRIGYNNLTIAFGETLSDREKDRILRTNFRNLGKSLAELLQFPRMSVDYLREKVTIVGQENFLNAKQKGRGVIYLTAHVGNWEMSSHAQSSLGNPLSIVVRPLNNPYLDNVLTRLRTMHGNKLLARNKSMRQIITSLKNKEAVGILMDQNALRSRGIFVDFFGKPACTVPVIAILALRYHVPVIPGFIVRTGFDTHTLHLGPEIEIQRTGNTQQDIAANTEHFNSIIADFIRQHPEQWFWIHNRWKTRPLNE
ncbi:lipid A biosynthesis acyltransferase [candidate division KSB3 bacterium]|uniref:Lipid A biosynthesis acyltransferase n=1 Tax=candidate division KSB3 bacterium TaxID=2044937 RepID=A0A2G6KKC8_9BACT|nr:MAG: lipid A biosynthesis acyltransferase [candidate division KSB3 bacterium]